MPRHVGELDMGGGEWKCCLNASEKGGLAIFCKKIPRYSGLDAVAGDHDMGLLGRIGRGWGSGLILMPLFRHVLAADAAQVYLVPGIGNVGQYKGDEQAHA